MPSGVPQQLLPSAFSAIAPYFSLTIAFRSLESSASAVPPQQVVSQQELSTGAVEVLANELTVLNPSETPPFQLDDEDVNEESRLRYRYVDLYLAV